MILITRPFQDSKALGARLKKAGYNCFIEPMAEIEAVAYDLMAYEHNPPLAFIVTSKNAYDAIPEDADVVGIPEQGQNAEELLEWIRDNLNPEDGKLVYLRGEKVSADIAGELAKDGFEVAEEIVYRAAAPKDLSERLVRNFEKLTAALFFSEGTLENFLALAKQHGLKYSHIEAYCLSEKIAAKAKEFKVAHVSAEPNLESMVRKIDEAYIF